MNPYPDLLHPDLARWRLSSSLVSVRTRSHLPGVVALTSGQSYDFPSSMACSFRCVRMLVLVFAACTGEEVCRRSSSAGTSDQRSAISAKGCKEAQLCMIALHHALAVDRGALSPCAASDINSSTQLRTAQSSMSSATIDQHFGGQVQTCL